MTQLFGCLCNQPHRLGEVVAEVRPHLVAAPPVSRWGLGYVHSGEVLLSLHPRSTTEPVEFAEQLAELNSDYIIGWASGDDSLRGDVNTQPFRYRRWFFAQHDSGPTKEAITALQPRLFEHVPDYLRRNLRGKSSAEHLFHVFLAMLHDAGALDDPNLDPAHIRRAVGGAIALCQRIAADAGTSWAQGNLIVSNSRSMVVARLAGPIQMRRIKQQADSRRPESELKAVLAIAGDMNGADGFEELPLRSALTINRDVSTDIAGIDS